jgi:HEPN domain-containing protein
MQEHDISLDYKAWLFKARGNLISAKRLIKDDDEVADHAIYHTQQCAELALKAFLAFKENPIRKVHDLGKLLELCMELDLVFESLKPKLSVLTPYATKFRYPDDYLVPDREDVLEAITYAEEILQFVRRRIEYFSNPTLKLF